MQNHVNRETFGQSKTFTTNRASEWLFTFVNSFVYVEIAQVAESLIANVTLELFARLTLCVTFATRTAWRFIFEQR